jgi:hypothetical protein
MGKDKVIREVLDLWKAVRAEGDSPEARERFDTLLRQRGWYATSGGFKTAMINERHDLVAKHAFHPGDDEHTHHEWSLYRRTTDYKRRFFARCYAYVGGLLIQRRVDLCTGEEDCRIARQYAQRFRILDWGRNHGHRPGGLPLFFDFDNSGPGWYSTKPARLTRSAA